MAVVGLECKQEKQEAGKKDHWANTLDWEVCKAQEAVPILLRLKEGWEMVHRQDPETSD